MLSCFQVLVFLKQVVQLDYTFKVPILSINMLFLPHDSGDQLDIGICYFQLPMKDGTHGPRLGSAEVYGTIHCHAYVTLIVMH